MRRWRRWVILLVGFAIYAALLWSVAISAVILLTKRRQRGWAERFCLNCG